MPSPSVALSVPVVLLKVSAAAVSVSVMALGVVTTGEALVVEVSVLLFAAVKLPDVARRAMLLLGLASLV